MKRAAFLLEAGVVVRGTQIVESCLRAPRPGLEEGAASVLLATVLDGSHNCFAVLSVGIAHSTVSCHCYLGTLEVHVSSDRGG